MNITSLWKLGPTVGLAGLVLFSAVGSSGCDDSPTTALVENGYPPSAGGAVPPATDATTVYRAWWVNTLFASPVPAGASSESERTIPGSDFAYALLAPGWSPDSETTPSRLVAVKSVQKLTATDHDALIITVSDAQFTGNCNAGSTLTDDDTRLIVERIFPGELAGVSYDPATCISTATGADGGVLDSAGDDLSVVSP